MKKNSKPSESKPRFKAKDLEATTEDIGAKQRLLDAAARLFAEKGLEGTSVRDIAGAAGLNLSLVSYYFGGKEGLYKELIRNFALTIRSEIQAIVSMAEAEELSQENLQKVFLLIVACISDIRSKHSEMSLVMHRERLAGLPHGREIHEDVFGPLGESLSQYIQKAQKKGLVRKDLNPLLIFLFLQEALIGFHNMVACNLRITQNSLGQTKSFKDFQIQLVQIFVKGIFV
jgi:AcrR family transcriptional regulator